MWSAEEVAELRDVGLAAGLAAVGVCSVGTWTRTRSVLEARRAEGLHASMSFTYRRPARSTEPARLLRDARSLVVGAWPYDPAIPERPPGAQARVARYATADHYGRLEAALGAMADHLRARGHRSMVISDDNGLVDREAAWRAGLGSSGKNSNLLLRGGGSWYVLGSVVTDAPLAPISVPVADQCGSCRRCLDGCPTGAIVAPGVVDARRCLSWILQQRGPIPHEYRRLIGDRLYGCDDCQEVCPPNRRAEALESPTSPASAASPPESTPGAWVDAVEALGASDAELLARFGRFYLAERDPGVLRRNLLIVLANSAPPAVAGAREAIADHLRHGDGVVAATAAWAALELGLGDLLTEAMADPATAQRPAIAAELAAAGVATTAAGGEDSGP